MGKKQVAQRVKNNYKVSWFTRRISFDGINVGTLFIQPSNSARAQLLLGNMDTYTTIPDKLKFPFAEILDCNVSPDFQVVLKKMNKKDSTTKVKVRTAGVVRTTVAIVHVCFLLLFRL